MVNLKSTEGNSVETPTVKRRGFNLKQLLLFILASILVHGLGLLMFALYQRSLPVTEEEAESKPIEFVVVPEETEVEPPPETEERAIENSVAEQDTEAEETIDDEQISDDIPPATAPEPEPVLPPEPTPPAPDPEPVPPPAAEPEPQPTAAEPEPDPVATRLPPEPDPEPPETTPPPTQPEENSASSLLGGDYQRTLANGGGDAFFSPEALEYESVLNPGQINALKDIDLGPYFDEVRRRVKSNWKRSYQVEEYTTFLTFDIQKNGQITGLRVTQSSGSEQVDRESLEAVQNSAPFAPLPPDFPLESLGVRFSFNIYIYY